MTIRIEMPQLSSEGESAALASWLVKAGDSVESGEVIAELETDKSTLELEAPAAGILSEIVVAAGTEDVEPGMLLALLEPEGDAAIASAEKSDTATAEPSPREATSPAAPARGSAPPDPEPIAQTIGRASTPLARRAAASHGLDLNALEGSGPGGRILEADVMRNSDGIATPVEAAMKTPGVSPTSSPPSPSFKPASSARSGSEAAGFESVRLSAMRKTIARRMTESKQQVPHFYLSIRCAMDAVIETRTKLNAELAQANAGLKISVNDFVVRAAALALREVPAANVSFAGDAMHVFDRVDIAVAVATDGGLVTPVVRSADRKGLTALAEEVKELAARARSGGLRPEEYQDGTFTISNLGMYGIDTVYPILNPPQACILGVGAAEEQACVREGEIVVGRIASITLAADHRAVDGAIGAQLLAAIRARLEDPLAMML